MRWTRAAVPVLVASLLVMPGTAVAAGPDYQPGAAGIGDPYFPMDGNGGYDVDHYDLALGYVPATDVLTGTATITARATQDLSAFNLDLDGLEVSAVTVNRRPAQWTRADGELTVTPARGVRARSQFTVVVTYAGVPETIEDQFGASGFFHTDDGAIVVGQPQVAATWFPANDHPSDKATFDLSITVPNGLKVVSNGAQASWSSSGGLTTTTWVNPAPMAPYLLMMAVGDFQLTRYRVGDVWYLDAVDPDLFATGTPSVGEVARGALARQPEIVRYLSGVFGPYPFRSAGGVVDDEPRYQFALENQSRPTYAQDFFTEAEDSEYVVVHEYAHQWFGDDVAIDRWQDIWLNEGFAVYAEWLWSQREGDGTVQERFDDAYATPADDDFWTVPPGDPGTDGVFDDAVYDRGAMTLHALRTAVGDRAFFTTLRRWHAERAGGNGTTPEFVALAEEVSGQQLDALFDAWLFVPAKPGR